MIPILVHCIHNMVITQTVSQLPPLPPLCIRRIICRGFTCFSLSLFLFFVFLGLFLGLLSGLFLGLDALDVGAGRSSISRSSNSRSSSGSRSGGSTRSRCVGRFGVNGALRLKVSACECIECIILRHHRWGWCWGWC